MKYKNNFQVPRHLEIMFMQNNRREIKLPDIEPEKSDEKDKKDKPKEKDEAKKGEEENNKEEKGDDDGNWKRRKTENADEEDDAADSAVAAKEDPEDHAVDAEKEAEIWKEADAPMLADEAAPEDQEEEET